MSGARVRVAVGASKVQLEPVSLVGDEVGVSVRCLTLGELNGRVSILIDRSIYVNAYRLSCLLSDGRAGNKSRHDRKSSEDGVGEQHGRR